MEEAPENGEEFSHSAHANGMSENLNLHIFGYKTERQKFCTE
jgi:hypothetical protein